MKNIVREWIIDYVRNYPESKQTLTSWQQPMVAFASAQDSLFGELKKTVSPTHALPTDFIADARTVISYFLPFEKEIAVSNEADKLASRKWATAYIETNRLILDLNGYIYDQLAQQNYTSSILPATHNFDTTKLISDWSHRHVAFIAGLGKFGLNNMLITDKGCCGRLGSIITTLELQPTLRTVSENCLYKNNKELCKKCVGRCVNDALTEESFNRHRCYEQCLKTADVYPELGFADACGKCLVDLPCSFANPCR